MPILKDKGYKEVSKVHMEKRREKSPYYGPPAYPEEKKQTKGKESKPKSSNPTKTKEDKPKSKKAIKDEETKKSNRQVKTHEGKDRMGKNNKEGYYNPNYSSRYGELNEVGYHEKVNKPAEFDPKELDKLKEVYQFKRSLKKPKYTVKDFLFNDVLAAPQKAAIYGGTTVSRGIGKGVYDTPSNVMRNDWGWGKTALERGLMQGADLVIDPLNALTVGPTKAFKKTILTKPYQGLRSISAAEARRNRMIKGIKTADKVADTDSNVDYLSNEAKQYNKEQLKGVRELIKGKKSILYNKK